MGLSLKKVLKSGACTILALSCLSLFACSIQEKLRTPTYISGSQFDVKSYSDEKISVLPVVVNPLYASDGLPLDDIRNAVIAQLKYVPLGKPEAVFVPTDRGGPNSYPWTPSRLRQVPLADGGGRIGISIVDWSERDIYQPASATMLITFADPRHAERTWVLSKSWAVADGGINDVAKAITHPLSYEFLDLGRFLKKGRRTFLMQPEVKVDVDDPRIILTASAKDIAPLPPLKTNRDFVDISISAISEDGIKSVTASNAAAKFERFIIRSSSEQTQEPLFYADTIRVPIAAGLNRVLISADGHQDNAKSRHELDIWRSASHRLINALLVSNLEVSSPDFAEEKDVVDRIRGAVTSRDSDNSFVAISAQSATEASILGAARSLRDHAGSDDTNIIYLLGRVRVFEGRAYFVAPVSGASKHWFIESSSIEKLANVTVGITGVIDACTNKDEVEDVRAALVKQLPPHWVAATYICTGDSQSSPSLGTAMPSIIRKLQAATVSNQVDGTDSWLLLPLMQQKGTIFGSVSPNGQLR